MSKKKQKSIILDNYPWLGKVNSLEDYLAPAYYHKLLKKYSFEGVSDLQYLSKFLSKTEAKNVLELGCGSGRATNVALRTFSNADFTLVDLSNKMIDYVKGRFSKFPKVKFITQDATSFLESTKVKYDLVYSLWSFSHSVHQYLHRLGTEKTSIYIKSVLLKFIRENLKKGGRFFLIHFDSMSDEQTILMRQWQRTTSDFSDLSQQSPSKRILDSILLDMDNHNEITLSVQHLQGDPIHYATKEELLEVYLNFHLETFFNKDSLLSTTVLDDIIKKSKSFKQSDGSYSIRPGCYIYSFTKK